MSDATSAKGEEFKTILLATDGSEFSIGTERVGMEMGVRHHAHLNLLRLVLAEAGSAEAAVEEEDASQHLEMVHAKCSERGISATKLIKYSQDPSRGILDAAKECNAQLLVVGRRGRRGMSRLMVGDATAKVIEKAECPVLVVPRLVTIWDSGILLVVDPSQIAGDAAAHAAIQLAQASSLPLTILFISENDESNTKLRDIYQSVNRLVAMAKLQKVDAEGMVQPGEIDDVVLEVVRQRSADLIVCEPRDRSIIDKLLNANNLLNLIGNAHCPVMVIPSRAPA